MPKNTGLIQARRGKADEFLTRLDVIEGELQYYTDQFKGKTVYLPCDEPEASYFLYFFAVNFKWLGLDRIITSCYREGSQGLATQFLGSAGMRPQHSDFTFRTLKGDGDFRSPECVGLLQSADIVVTNPPFSKFRDFMSQLVEHDKKYLILGNVNACKYKSIFPLIQANKLWLGPSIRSGDRTFKVPDHYPLEGSNTWADDDGTKYIQVKGVRWFTNMPHTGQIKPLELTCGYSSGDYPTYDNFDAIEVSYTKDIPKDYDGLMGVPITFLDRYNPNQFEIIGTERELTKKATGKVSSFYVGGRECFSRIVIKRKV